jgi:hypothetical protein
MRRCIQIMTRSDIALAREIMAILVRASASNVLL